MAHSIKYMKVFATVLIAAFLSGCATSVESLIPQGGKKIDDIYSEHMREVQGGGSQDIAGLQAAAAARPIVAQGLDSNDRETAMHSSAKEVDARFARLPNPDIVMYIAPHLTKRGTPVPGYTTVIPMYERVEYALPGEVRGTRFVERSTAGTTRGR